MARDKLNVLVYAGHGSTVECVRHCLYTLRRLLAPRYAVITISSDSLIKDPWTASCALLCFPGGADLQYCQTLNGAGNRRISQYVSRGGAYLGFCAGGYYGTKRCEFEVGNKRLEVVGNRELGFFPGICRGGAFPGFVYHSEAGARATELKVVKTGLSKGTVPQVFRSYYNGGGVFVDADEMQDSGVEILAEYTEPLAVNGGTGSAAVVYCKVGEGQVVLTGPHPEFASINLEKSAGGPEYAKIVDALTEDDHQRVDFLKACLLKLNLSVSSDQESIPSLSRLYLSSVHSFGVTKLLESIKDLIVTDGRIRYIYGENDTFQLDLKNHLSHDIQEELSIDQLSLQESTASNSSKTKDDQVPGSRNDHIEPHRTSTNELISEETDTLVKQVVLHEIELPACKETPYFNHHAFFSNLRHYQSHSRLQYPQFGNYLLYGEIVTSTNTLLEKNPSLLSQLPQGFTASATTQIAGRGRGSNIWLSPAGCLIFSTCIRHSMELSARAPVVFVQYLIAMAVAEGVRSYDRGSAYANLPVKLKWPNDVYALDPTDEQRKRYVKIGGILVNSSYSQGNYLLVVGLGLNVSNTLPTTGLNALLAPGAQRFTIEKLLARILTKFEELYEEFCLSGFGGHLEKLYYRHWLHEDQIITLENENGARAKIRGLTTDWGLLKVEELGWEDRPTGRMWELQSDANSFDFLKGLIRRKK